MEDYIVRLENVTKTYEDGFTVLDNINLAVKHNEFVTLLGPSGCGKTTTLRIIAGFVNATSGDVYFENKRINDVPAHKRNLNTVFQSYALFTHMNVFDNIAFGLKIKGVKKSEIESKVKDVLRMVNLSGYEKRDIGALSGGQQQRIAIARAVVNEPALLLLDEPAAGMNPNETQELMDTIKSIRDNFDMTILLIEHDMRLVSGICERLTVLNFGQELASGATSDVLSNHDVITAYLGE